MLTVFDFEVCPDNWLVSFKDLETSEYTSFWGHDRDSFLPLTQYIMGRTLVGFNSDFYDMPILASVLDNCEPHRIKHLSDKIITEGLWPWQAYRFANLAKPNVDHIDIMGVAPGFVGLKAYGGRMHMKTIQDLPFDHTVCWTPDMYDMVEKYCFNDLDTTEEMVVQLEKALMLRVNISNQYGVDVRSQSDTRVAEKLLISQLGLKYGKNEIPLEVRYVPPEYLFEGDERLVALARKMATEVFDVKQKTGHVIMPAWLKEPMSFKGGIYKMGVGGLHSQHDSKVCYTADDEYAIFEIDAASFYPTILINSKLGSSSFTEAYKQIYDDRLKGKAEMKKAKGARLQELKDLDGVKKIELNGTFGKLAAKGSPLYNLTAMLHITITGQLTLLALINTVAKVSEVVSANTDGIVVRVRRGKQLNALKTAVKAFGELAKQNFEFTEYDQVAFRDVNNYFAVKTEGGVKRKGTYAKAGLTKNPVCEVCANAVAEWMDKGIPFAETIKNAPFTDFVTVRNVTGGGVYEGEYLGRVVRWYYSTEGTSLHYKKNGNLVPKSTGGKPCMTLPESYPADLNYSWYWKECKRIAKDTGLEV